MSNILCRASYRLPVTATSRHDAEVTGRHWNYRAGTMEA